MELEVDDLLNVLKIINTATERGAFKANELSFVGQTYDKFATFVRAAQAEQQSTAETGEPSENDSE